MNDNQWQDEDDDEARSFMLRDARQLRGLYEVAQRILDEMESFILDGEYPTLDEAYQAVKTRHAGVKESLEHFHAEIRKVGVKGED
jgi:hypothetical protein